MDEKIIGGYIGEPLVKSNKSTFITYYCKCPVECPFLKIGQCINRAILTGCIYGRCTHQQGYSRRSTKYYSWVREKQEVLKTYPELPFIADECVTEIGDYIYLPYAHMLNKEIGFDLGKKFIKKCEFTTNKIIEMISKRPQSLFGGEITDYQRKIVPLFLKHLEYKFPEIYKEVISKLPNRPTYILPAKLDCPLRYIEPNITNGYVVRGMCPITWDGQMLNITGKWPISSYAENNIKIKGSTNSTITYYPNLDKEYVTIEDKDLMTTIVSQHPELLQNG